jgi:sugar phosphate isomerase/epimerase
LDTIPALRIGVDSYSYHRLLGEIRPGESAPATRWSPLEPVRHARDLGVDGISLETTFLGEVGTLREAAGPLELVLAWGHPHGLELGRNPAALDDLLAWLERAPGVGCTLVRCVAGSPTLRGTAPIETAAAPLAAAAARARELGLVLALENHGECRATELADLLERVGDDTLRVCFDSANALRVGDDPVEAAVLLGPLVSLVHLKDVAALETVTDPVAGPRSTRYGEGVIAIPDVLDALDAAGFDGLVCVEIGQLGPGDDELDLVEDGVQWLRSRLRPS